MLTGAHLGVLPDHDQHARRACRRWTRGCSRSGATTAPTARACSARSSCRRRCPSIFTGLRLGLGLALVAIVAVEFIAAKSGLGHLVYRHWQMLSTPEMYGAFALVGALGLVLTRGLRALQRRMLAWQDEPGDCDYSTRRAVMKRSCRIALVLLVRCRSSWRRGCRGPGAASSRSGTFPRTRSPRSTSWLTATSPRRDQRADGAAAGRGRDHDPGGHRPAPGRRRRDGRGGLQRGRGEAARSSSSRRCTSATSRITSPSARRRGARGQAHRRPQGPAGGAQHARRRRGVDARPGAPPRRADDQGRAGQDHALPRHGARAGVGRGGRRHPHRAVPDPRRGEGRGGAATAPARRRQGHRRSRRRSGTRSGRRPTPISPTR